MSPAGIINLNCNSTELRPL